MRQMYKAVLIGMLGFLTTTINSATTHILRPGVAVEYELPPMDPQIFPNIFMWTVHASCTVLSTQGVYPISVKVLRRSGTLNGEVLSKGDSLEIWVKEGDKFQISAESGASVEILNKGEQSIKATCTTT